MEKVSGDGEEESEYESDPEELKMSLKMRRREASDDEDVDDVSPRPVEVDGEGGAADYEDEEEEEKDYYEEEERVVGEERAAEAVVKEVAGEGEGEEKKDNEPFAVPTSGAFYMHDDRLRDSNAAGKHRRTFGGRNLWESKDDRKWGHDKFEETNFEDRRYEVGHRSSRGCYRGRGKSRGTDRGNARGGRTKGYDGNNNQAGPPKDVRGRGPRRYQPSTKNRSETTSQHYKQSGKSVAKNSHAASRRVASTTASLNVELEHEQVLAKKVASNLNSASPPFYPSGSSNDIDLPPKKEVQAGNHNRNHSSSAADRNISMSHSHSNNMMRGKDVIDSMGMDKLHIDDSVPPATVKPSNSVQKLPSASPLVGAVQMTQLRSQGRGGLPSGSAISQPQTNNLNNKISSSAAQPSQQLPDQNRAQSFQHASGQQFIQRPLSGSQTTSSLKGLPVTTFEPGSFEPSEPGKSKAVVAVKGKGTIQGTGRGALVYGGAQAMGSGGNANTGHGDPNLPSFFPVMQFGGQHPGGIPAVGMAFPGYVAQPNGLGNSEMTWLPVLSGALGGSYCPPYLAVDSSFNPRPTAQTPALPALSKDNNQFKSSNEPNPQQRSDVVNDEFSQRQNKPRRYSEMNFSQ